MTSKITSSTAALLSTQKTGLNSGSLGTNEPVRENAVGVTASQTFK